MESGEFKQPGFTPAARVPEVISPTSPTSPPVAPIALPADASTVMEEFVQNRDPSASRLGALTWEIDSPEEASLLPEELSLLLEEVSPACSDSGSSAGSVSLELPAPPLPASSPHAEEGMEAGVQLLDTQAPEPFAVESMCRINEPSLKRA